MKPIYIGLANKNNHLDIKRAWSTLIGKLPSNVPAVQDLFYRIDGELDKIYQGIGELKVRLCVPLRKQSLKYMNTVMCNVVRNKPIPEVGHNFGGIPMGVAIELATAIRETDGFVLDSMQPVKYMNGVLELQLTGSKSNDENKKPFSLHIGNGYSMYHQTLAFVRREAFPKKSWVFVLEHCKHEIAWNIWKKVFEEKEFNRAVQMTKKSMKQHEKNKDGVKTN